MEPASSMVESSSRAAVFRSPGAPLELLTRPVPELVEGEILARVLCCTLCGSDLHTYRGRRSTPTPTILGHEILAEVAAIGAGSTATALDGREVRVGDRVTWSIAASCGTCAGCTRGLPQKCDDLFKYGHEKDDATHALSGGLADHCILRRGTAIVHVPPALDDRVACPANCATATVAAVLRAAGIEAAGTEAGAVVLVQGAGMLGLTAGAMSRWRGAREVITADPDARRLALAPSFGATRVVEIDPGENDDELEKTVARVTDGRGVDIAIEVSGDPAAIERGLPLLRVGGCYVWAGAVFPDRPVSILAETVVRRLVTVRGVHNYVPEDLSTAIEFLAQNHARYPFKTLVSKTFSLSDVESAFRHAIGERPLRVAVTPWKDGSPA